MSAYEFYIGRSDGAASNALVKTELVPLRGEEVQLASK